MIEDAPIVKDTREVRNIISQQFEHDIDRYIDYLSAQTTRTKRSSNTRKPTAQSHTHRISKKPISA